MIFQVCEITFNFENSLRSLRFLCALCGARKTWTQRSQRSAKDAMVFHLEETFLAEKRMLCEEPNPNQPL